MMMHNIHSNVKGINDVKVKVGALNTLVQFQPPPPNIFKLDVFGGGDLGFD